MKIHMICLFIFTFQSGDSHSLREAGDCHLKHFIPEFSCLFEKGSLRQML